MNVITQAIRDLRARLGESQQKFSNRLWLTIGAIAQYEGKLVGRVPSRPDILANLAITAFQSGHFDLAKVFADEFLVHIASKREKIKQDFKMLQSIENIIAKTSTNSVCRTDAALQQPASAGV